MKKLISIIATSAILLNSLVTPLSALAQEATPTPTIETTELFATTEASSTPTDIASPTPAETVIPEATATSTPLPELLVEEILPVEAEPQVAEPSATLVVSEPQPVEKVYLSDGQAIINTVNTDWNIDEANGSAETKEAVKLGVKYIFPLNDKVTVTFKSLPTDESLRTTIKIVKVKVSDLNLPDNMNPYGEYAYDITTDMSDGTFDYDLTLPKPDGQSVDVAYMEDTDSTPLTIAENQTSQEGGTVKASDINHFTIFVVVNPNPAGNGSTSNNTCLTAAAGGAVTCYDTIQAAIDASTNGDEIEIQSDITVGQQVNVNKDVTIDGNGFTVSPNFGYTNNSNNSTFGIHSSGVTISNLTVDGASGTNLHGINIYMVNNILLDGVSVLNNDKSGITVNGSIVTVNNITTAGNGWGGINVDQGVGVTTEAKLIIAGTSSHNEAAHIWLDDFRKATVDDTSPPQYQVTNGLGNLRIYTLKNSNNASASLEQCRNGTSGSPNDCLSLGGSVGWVNGNAGSSNSHYVEGLSIPYRTIMEDLPLGTPITITLEYDIKHSGAHAIDFLTSYNRLQPHSPFGHSVESIDPTSGVAGVPGTYSTYTIPTPSSVGSPVSGQPTDRFNSLPADEKLMTLYGGTISNVVYATQGDLNANSASTSINVTFTATSATAVLAWGGHIAREADWGTNQSAGGINGSPYHMRLINWTQGSLGNQDRSLSAGAVAAPSSITIVKDAQPDNFQDFTFVTTGNGLSSFTLDDDADGTLLNMTTFNSLLAGTFTITEDSMPGWSLFSKTCVTDGTSNSPSTFSPITDGISINLVAGENITCTFTNTQQNGTLRVNKITVPNEAEVFSVTATGSGTITGTATQNVTGGSFVDYTVTTGTYSVTESPKIGWAETNNTCTRVSVSAGGISECTITNTKLGSISGFKYEVGNQTPLAGWIISLYQEQTLIATQSTTLSGYSFNNLLPGIYSLFENLLGGWTQVDSPSNIDLAAGQSSTGNDFVNFHNVSISGQKFNDLNGNGTKDAGEPGLSGWTINLDTGANGSVDATTMTDTSGNYTFSVGPGIYRIRESGQIGWSQTTTNPVDFTVVSGQNVTGVDFGNFNLGQISGKKYEDLNGNGEDDTGEPGLWGWLIYIDTNNNGQLDSGERSTSTDPTGHYTFSDLGPGTYIIREQNNEGWAQTDPTGLDTSVGGQNDGSYIVAMTSNGNKTERNFGNQMRGSITITKSAIPQDVQNFGFTSPQLGSFTLNDDGNGSDSYKIFPNLGSNTNGITYTITEDLTTGWKLTNISCTGDEDVAHDVNGRTVTLTLDHPTENVSCEFTNTKLGSISGFKYAQGSQVPLTGWTISLYQNQTLLASQVTTAEGYKFDNLSPGAYSLSEGLLSGWTQISIPSSVVITAGQDSTNNNFINFLNGNIAGYKWNDLDGNGAWDNEEPPIEGWKIYLDRPDGPDIYDLTNASGHYYFGDLGPGTYRVYEEVQPSWTQTAPSGSEYIIDMTQGAQGLNNPNYNFGNQRLPVTIKGYKVICENESDLPNWGNHGSTIDADTAQDYVDSHSSCSLSEDWDFQYGPSGAGSFGSFQTDTNSLAGSWNTFNVSSDAIINDLSNFGGRIEVREVFPDNTYLPFSNSGDFSAEFYCSGDTYNYDNWEWINNPQYDQTYYCVAFNTLNPGHIIVDKVTDPERDPQVFTFNPSWSENNFTLTDQDNPLDSGPLAPGVYSVSELKQDGWSLEGATCDNKGLVDEINLHPGETVTCTFSNLKLNPNITVTKSNDRSGGTTAGSTVTYTLTVKNDGNVDLQGVDIIDILPGGFGFVAGSTTGTAVVPTVSGSVITWSNVGDLAVGASFILTYQATISTDSTNGLYTNFATCDSYYYGGDEEQTSVPCNTANSTVSIGSVLGYGGNLQGQVLGASTELPATGSPTLVLIVALVMLATGLFLNGFTKREEIKPRKHAKK